MQRPDGPAGWRPESGALRLFRASAAGSVSSVTAWLAHSAGGGSVPVVAATAMLCGASVVAWALTYRRVTPAQLVGLLIACQAVTHVACGSHSATTMSLFMLCGHAAATAVSAVAMARGERWLWMAYHRLSFQWLGKSFALVVPTVPQPRRTHHEGVPVADPSIARLFERGPPVSVI